MTNIEIEIKMFHNKNPHALHEYCDFAATLYAILLQYDAFENGVQIENIHTSFRFLFPNGQIEIASKILLNDPEPVICYICHINGSSQDFFFFDYVHLSSWLQENWDLLITGVKK